MRLALAALAIGALLAAFLLFGERSRVAPVAAVSMPPAELHVVEPELPDALLRPDAEALDTPPSAPREVEPPPADAASEGVVKLSARDALADLVDDLERLLAEDPEGAALALGAPELLVEFAAGPAAADPEFASRYEALLGDTSISEEVHGSLHALWAPLMVDRDPPDVSQLGSWARRGLRLGALASWPGVRGGPPGESGIRIDIRRFFDTTLHPVGPRLLMFTLERMPNEALEAELAADLAALGTTEDAFIERELAVFGLGTALGRQPWVLDFFAELLADSAPFGAQVRMAVLFVLTQSEDPDARALLFRFLEGGSLDSLDQNLVRLWLSKRPSSWAEIESMCKPLTDGLPLMESAGAAAVLTRQLDGAARGEHADPVRLAELQAFAAGIVENHPDPLVRMGLASSLGNASTEGAARQRALVSALHLDTDPLVRLMAVRGLAKTTGPEAVAARAELLARQTTETDPKVKAELDAIFANGY